MKGIIYILTNQAMDGLVKIGKTTDLRARLRQLDNTSVPFPFECFYAAEVADVDGAERLLHEAFGDRRLRSNREFFKLEPARAKAALRLAALADATPLDVVAADDEGEKALATEKTRRPPMNMLALGVPLGALLVHVDDPSITCRVTGPREVDFSGQRMALAQATRLAFKQIGTPNRSGSYQGGKYWLYESDILVELRRRQDEISDNAPAPADCETGLAAPPNLRAQALVAD